MKSVTVSARLYQRRISPDRWGHNLFSFYHARGTWKALLFLYKQMRQYYASRNRWQTSSVTQLHVSFYFALLCFVLFLHPESHASYKSQTQYNAKCLVITVMVLVWSISSLAFVNKTAGILHVRLFLVFSQAWWSTCLLIPLSQI